jgi:hypothetical protein
MRRRLSRSLGILDTSHSPMFLVCHFSMNEFSDPVLHAPLEGVVGGPALSIAHWYPAIKRVTSLDPLLHHKQGHQDISMLNPGSSILMAHLTSVRHPAGMSFLFAMSCRGIAARKQSARPLHPLAMALLAASVLAITLEICCARLAGPSYDHPCGAQRAQRYVPGRVQRNGVWHIHLQ